MRKVLYIAPDVPVPHTGEFLGGSTHVLKVAESGKRLRCIYCFKEDAKATQI